ncbi:hypothetical protein IHQ68_09635 [Chelatococcus sambhunathii]|uniref:Prepilin-type N-terminal cleavage/methylation domain n=1 Tax=Chelatococcus sambhunathii TaxID=363953 RepID=A0ABU1DFH1_9HYPH|nr:hypothetical protein [Chelatococcus sambhunathii]MDR4306878.1 hypothetical protein [Chelatococcus sambhunathii]
MSGRARIRGREGFLMIEALSALALGALILVAMLSLTGLLRRSVDRAAWGVEVSEVSTRTVGTIARELRQAQRRRWAAPPQAAGAQATPRPAGPSVQPTAQANASDPNNPAARAQQMNAAGAGSQGDGAAEGGSEAAAPPRPFVFSGAPDRVTFALTPRQDSGLRAPVFVAYQIEASGAVLRAEAPLRLDAMGPAGVELGPVARIDPGPERLRFAYVQRDAAGNEAILDAWSDPMKMPAAVRIDRFDAATGQAVGSLRVPLLIDAEPACAGQKGQCSRVESAAAGAQQPDAVQQPGQKGANPSGESQ